MGFPRSANSIPSGQAAVARLRDTRVGRELIINRSEQHMQITDQTLPNIRKIPQRESNLPVIASQYCSNRPFPGKKL